MAAKIGSPDRQGVRKSVAALSNVEIVDKTRFKPKDWHKMLPYLRQRGLVWTES